jgi:hypothetical protein
MDFSINNKIKPPVISYPPDTLLETVDFPLPSFFPPVPPLPTSNSKTCFERDTNPMNFINTFCDLPQVPMVPHVSDDEFPLLPPVPVTKIPRSSPVNHVVGDISSESSSSLFLSSDIPSIPRVSEDLMMTFSVLPPAPPVPVVVLPP